MTPKSLLRHPECRSSFDEMIPGSEFKRLIPDDGSCNQNPDNVKKLIFCTGKVYFDLIKARTEAGLEDQIAIATLEQISPFPFDLVKVECDKYANAECVFVQEEHKNHGAWAYCLPRFQTAVGGYERRFHYVGREVSNNKRTTGQKVHDFQNYTCTQITTVKYLYLMLQVAPSPATGSKAMHMKEFKAYMNEAMSL